MEIKEILAKCDHTLLTQTATPDDIRRICDEGIEFGTASVCIPPCYVDLAARYSGGRIPICTVIGFPNGNMTTAAKCFETRDAVANGASEIDMVINIGMLRAGRVDYVRDEIAAVRAECRGRVLKVIIETCLLTDEEKKLMCSVVAQGGADYIKTSTGFSKGGATKEDIRLFAENVPAGLKIKAAGGISTLADAEEFIKLGASRLGTSRIVKLAKERRGNNI